MVVHLTDAGYKYTINKNRGATSFVLLQSESGVVVVCRHLEVKGISSQLILFCPVDTVGRC